MTRRSPRQLAAGLGWIETDPGQWTTRQIPCWPAASPLAASEYLLGHVLAVQGGFRWLVDLRTTVSQPPYQTVREGRVDTLDAAKEAASQAIRDTLAP